MKEPEILNATITGTTLGPEDHGIFTCYLLVKGDAWGCGFGGYAMDTWDAEKKKRTGTAYGMKYIMAILETLKVGKWEDLKGQHIRVESCGWGGRITRIGHLIEDRWFDPKQFSEEYSKAEALCTKAI